MPDFFLFQKGSIHHQQQPGERERRHRPFPSTIRLKCIKDYFSEKILVYFFVGFRHSFFVHPTYQNSFEDYDQEKKKIPKGTTTQSSSIIKAILFQILVTVTITTNRKLIKTNLLLLLYYIQIISRIHHIVPICL